MPEYPQKTWVCPEDEERVYGDDLHVRAHFEDTEHAWASLAGFTDGGPVIAGAPVTELPRPGEGLTPDQMADKAMAMTVQFMEWYANTMHVHQEGHGWFVITGTDESNTSVARVIRPDTDPQLSEMLTALFGLL